LPEGSGRGGVLFAAGLGSLGVGVLDLLDKLLAGGTGLLGRLVVHGRQVLPMEG